CCRRLLLLRPVLACLCFFASDTAHTETYTLSLHDALPISTLEIRFPGDWYDHPTYLDALAERMEEALQGLSPEERAETPVIFSAHSIPTRFVEQGDPYVEQLRAAAAGIHDRVGPFPWELAFQSVGQASREPWVGPEVEEVMDRFHAEGYRRVVVNPIGFVADHLETLYDNDVLHQEHAAKPGLEVIRVPCRNLQAELIGALAARVGASRGESEGQRAGPGPEAEPVPGPVRPLPLGSRGETVWWHSRWIWPWWAGASPVSRPPWRRSRGRRGGLPPGGWRSWRPRSRWGARCSRSGSR